MTTFRERLVPGVGTALALILLAPAVALVVLPLGFPAAAPLVAAVVVTAAAEALLFGLTPVIEVRDGELRVGAARIPVGQTGEVESLRGPEARHARGPGLDARAYTVFRPSIDPVLKIEITDPDDPVPYWLISTRRPDELAGALAAARTR
ncbi:DUF3093 domain-containing protein [Amnibacterium endophyticum]|uniref:DUF3093 domain-containing protein n=1 Tax=Amnibacterium endophyticum TaxID=2109337 RepID=A0ABW4LHU1_9MICO